MSRLLTIGAMLYLSFVIVANAALPTGYEQAQWGISVADLQKLLSVVKAQVGTDYGYADHREVDPDVYVHITPENKRLEFYFFKNKLYKIFIVYDQASSGGNFYKQLIDEKRMLYGNAQSHYQENIMGITVLHSKWEDERSILDIRNGAGYVYEVMIDKAAQRAKVEMLRRRNSI